MINLIIFLLLLFLGLKRLKFSLLKIWFKDFLLESGGIEMNVFESSFERQILEIPFS